MTDADAIRAGYCPVCEAGPYKVILGHLAQSHQLTRQEARDRYGLRRSESVCSPEHHARRAELSRGNGFRQVIRRATYTCAWCERTFTARTYKDGTGIARFCSKSCKRRAGEARLRRA